MAEKDQTPGEIDFSDGELSEMGVELAGRAEQAPTPRRSRSMLRVPVDEVPRPKTGQHEAASTTEPSLKGGLTKDASGGNVKGAAAVGQAIAERLKAKGITRVVFDRNGFLYHGRIKAVADAARQAGLEF